MFLHVWVKVISFSYVFLYEYNRGQIRCERV